MISETLFTASTALVSVAIIALVSLRGWQGWLQLKTRELEMYRSESDGGSTTGMARIEMADLKERIRKLEAIAAGVDL